jgi:OOP family OmpA-OmpF porin
MKTAIKTLIVASALIGIGAQAQSLSGLYVGGSLGDARMSGSNIGGLNYDKSEIGGKVHLGYSFTPNIALELGYANLGKHDGSIGNVKEDGYFLDAVGTYPLFNNFSAIGRVGVFNGKVDSSTYGSDRATNVKFGAGVQYTVTQNIAIRGEWERYKFDSFGSSPKTDLYTVGVNYSF